MTGLEPAHRLTPEPNGFATLEIIRSHQQNHLKRLVFITVSRLLRIHHIISTKCLMKDRCKNYLVGIHATSINILNLSGGIKTYCDVFANRLKIAINTKTLNI